jgi:hypothetical protein
MAFLKAAFLQRFGKRLKVLKMGARIGMKTS